MKTYKRNELLEHVFQDKEFYLKEDIDKLIKKIDNLYYEHTCTDEYLYNLAKILNQFNANN